jgi:hypothetical protein
MERGSLDQVVVSLREGEASNLGLQASPSCPGVSTRSSMVIAMVLLQCRGVAWHDATVPVVMALLVRWWFTNYPARRGLIVAFVIISCSPGGIVATVWEQVATRRSSVTFVGCITSGLNPGLRGRGHWWLGRS